MKGKTQTKTLRSKLINLKQLFRDYEARPELDRYENDGIDDDSEQAIIDQQLKAALDNERDDEEYWVEQEKIPFVNRLWQKDHRLAQYERQADEETSEEQQSLKSETQQKPGEYGIIDGEAVIEAGMTLEEQKRKKRE